MEKTQLTSSRPSEKPTQIETIGEAKQFLEWARTLGETITPQELAKLRGDNFRVLDILTKDFEQRKPNVKEGKWAIIIPAYNERWIGELLIVLSSQLSLISQDETLGYRQTEIIISINNEQEGGITEKAVGRFLEENKLPERVSLKILKTPQQGKLIAFDAALNYLEEQPEFPEYLYFFDADTKVKPGCIAALHDLLLHGNQAAGARIVPQEPKNILEALASLPTKGHGSEGALWLQGGAFAIRAEIASLYHAYTRAFPGTIANDVNWSVILHAKNIPFSLTSDPYLIMNPPFNMVSLLKQQDRWLKGSRQTAAFSGDSSPIIDTSILQKTVKRIKSYFPNFPKVDKEQIKNFINRGIAKEIWGVPFFSALYLVIDKLKEPVTLKIQGKNVNVGGPPPNPYRPGGWQPPREYLN